MPPMIVPRLHVPRLPLRSVHSQNRGHWRILRTFLSSDLYCFFIRSEYKFLSGALFKVSSTQSPYCIYAVPSVTVLCESFLKTPLAAIGSVRESIFAAYQRNLRHRQRRRRRVMSEIPLRLRVEGATHESLNHYGTRDGSDTLWNTTLRRPTGRSRVRYERRAAGVCQSADGKRPQARRQQSCRCLLASGRLGGWPSRLRDGRHSDVRCLSWVHLKGARRAESGQECADTAALARPATYLPRV